MTSLFFSIAMGLVWIYGLYGLIVGLKTGLYGVGKGRFAREEDPVEFWFQVALGAVALLLVPYLVWGLQSFSVFMAREALAFFMFLFVVERAFYLLRHFQTGKAGGGDLTFYRNDEPLEFWLLAGFNALLLVACGVAFVYWIVPTR